MAVIEGFVIDDKGDNIMFAVLKVLDAANEEIAVGYSNEDGEFTIDVPEGKKYQICCFTQSYQPLCSKITDQKGNWTELTKEGRRIRIETTKVTLSTTPP